MKQGKEILEKHLKEMDSTLPALDQLRMRLPTELVDLDDIYLERFLNSREGQRFIIRASAVKMLSPKAIH